MTKAYWLSFLAAVAVSVPVAAQDGLGVPAASMNSLGDSTEANSCKTAAAAEVVVCGRLQQKYRIDPNVLAGTRATDALPPKPQLDASKASGCVGPECGGTMIPLVGMALTAVKAATLAAQGDDWREAFRTHPDQYQAYRAASGSKVSIGVGVSADNK